MNTDLAAVDSAVANGPLPPPAADCHEELMGWFAELEKLRAERLPYPTEEERLADWNWLHDQMTARTLGDYHRVYIAVYRSAVVGTDTDATRLELAMAHKYPDINPDRFIITYVG
jgi:hypothetical protein